MRGSSSRWDPWVAVHEKHFDAQVITTSSLSGRMLGCVDHTKKIIWLAEGLTEVQQRCTLAFELAELQQGPAPDDPCLAAARHRAAEEWAAVMLIDGDDLLSAIGCSDDLAGVAAWLGVDTQTVRARFRGLTNAEQDAVFLAHRGKRLSA